MDYQYSEFAANYLGWDGRYSSGANCMVNCLWHDDQSPSLSFDTERGFFLCWSCAAQGNIITIARKVGLNVIGDGYIPDLDDPAQEAAALSRMLDGMLDEPPDTDPLPESALRTFQRAPTTYWTSRGLEPATIAAWQLGALRFPPQATIPVRAPFTDALLGVIRRNLAKNAKPRYLNPKNFPKNTTLFGSWMDDTGDQPSTIVLCEGPVDAIKVWQAGYNGRALMGSKLAREQVSIMLKYGVEQVVLFLDDDRPGFDAAVQVLGRLHRRFDVKAAVYPAGNVGTDPGSLSDQQIRQAVDGAVDLTNIITF